ncbi:hypothetical protein LDL59_06645 [Kaistella anthropi]|nr:hypothetical protein [Kaistella anthropi]
MANNAAANGQIPDEIQKEFKVLNLIEAYRQRGHLFTNTNPVRERRHYEPTLAIENFGLSQQDLNKKFNSATETGMPGAATLQEIINHLEKSIASPSGLNTCTLIMLMRKNSSENGFRLTIIMQS